MANNESWERIFKKNNVLKHDFKTGPFYLNANTDIKPAVLGMTKTTETEVRILCKMDTREQVPEIMKENKLFLLPVKNGDYALVKGEGYLDIPEITKKAEIYESKLDFELESSEIGNSEMQHLDFAYASSLIRTFANDPSLVLTIRGRKYTPEFSFKVGKQLINTKGVQTEVDAGYEGKNKIVLVEAKNTSTKNTIIRQLFYPYKQWTENTNKEVFLVFFEKRAREYLLWEFKFTDPDDYNSVKLVKSKKYLIE